VKIDCYVSCVSAQAKGESTNYRTRSFGHAITELHEVAEAITEFASRVPLLREGAKLAWFKK